MGALEQALRFRLARQSVLASNVANADTPGYRRSDVVFQERLDAASRVRRSDPHHLSGPGGSASEGWKAVREARGDRPDGNGVDFDRELVELTRNAGAFTEAANVHSRIVALMRMAISGDAR